MSETAEEPRYVNLGNSGLKISQIILGCMSYGDKKWIDWVVEDEEEVMKILKKAYDLGIRTWDTADMYSGGVSEELIGKFIKKYDIPRETLVILSKCFFYVDMDNLRLKDKSTFNPATANRHGLSRKHILDAVDQSVKRLGTYIDVLQIHRYDSTVPDEEVMRALNDVVDSGKVRYIGASSMRVYQFQGLQHVAEKHGWHKFISMQNLYNLLYREEEREMIPYCKQTNVGIIPWSPIAGGFLARPKASSTETVRAGTNTQAKMYLEGPNSPVIDRVEEIAKKHNVPMAVVSTAWVRSKGCQPIVGISSIKRLEDAVASLKFELTEEEKTYLEELYKPIPVFGHA